MWLLAILTACQQSALPNATATRQPATATDIPAATPTEAVELTQTSLPSLSPLQSFTEEPQMRLEEVEELLIEGVDWFLQVETTDGDILLSRNEDESFPPASMIKIPTAMAVLKILQEEGRSLADIQSFGISGRNFADLLEAMVVRSEENATDALEFYARGDNRLRKILDHWGLAETTFDPRRSTVGDLINSLRLLDTTQALNAEFTEFLLELMGIYTENDTILLGKLLETSPECTFLNKRGTLLNPTIASDMGILRCGEQSWYLVVAGSPATGSVTNFEDIQASIEEFALKLATFLSQTQP